jgi:ABC-type amino acid transport substrate-binding protein
MATQSNRTFILLMSVVFACGIAFLVHQFYAPTISEIPETIIVGTSTDYPPFSFTVDNKVMGFDIDVATESIKRLGKKIEIKDVPFELLIPQTAIGSLHVIAADLAITPEREKLVLFTSPYITNGPLVVLTKSENPAPKKLEDLTNKRVVVNKGYTADAYISDVSYLAIERVPTLEDGIKALKENNADALVTSADTIPSLFETYGQENFNTFVINDVNENAGLAVSKMYPELAQQLNDIIEQMDADGTLDQLKQKWNLQ